jgi:hypothetical protein
MGLQSSELKYKLKGEDCLLSLALGSLLNYSLALSASVDADRKWLPQPQDQGL